MSSLKETLGLSEPVAYLVATVLCIIFVVAVFGNIVVIGTLLRSWQNTINKTGNCLVFLVAIVDLVNVLTSVPVCLVTIAAGEWIMGDVVCQISGGIFVFFLTFSSNLLSMISLNRYLQVQSPNIHPTIQRKRAIRMSLYALCLGILITLSMLIPWGCIDFTPQVDIMCVPQWESTVSSFLNLIFCWTSAVIVPVSIMGFTSLKIWKLIRNRSIVHPDNNGTEDIYCINNNGRRQSFHTAETELHRPNTGLV